MTPMEQSERKGLVERLPELRRLALAVHDPNEWASGTAHIELNAADRAYISALDPQTVLALLDLLSSDARPAPMAEEVKAALHRLRADTAIIDHDGNLRCPFCEAPVPRLTSADNAKHDPACPLAVVSAHIDDLTRKVAEAETWTKRARQAEFSLAALGYPWLPCPICGGTESCDDTVRERAVAVLSRPQETDAVLAEREACAKMAAGYIQGGHPVCTSIAAAIRSRPSPGPTTETDTARMDWLEQQVVNVRDALPHGSRDLFWASPGSHEDSGDPSDLRAQIDRALLASVRPKEEGV